MTPGAPELIRVVVLFLFAVVAVLRAGIRQDARINRQIRAEWLAWIEAGRPDQMTAAPQTPTTLRDSAPAVGDVEDPGDVSGVAA